MDNLYNNSSNEKTNYKVIISKKEGKFYAYIQELSIVEDGSSETEAYQKAEKKKILIIEKMLSAGLEDYIPKIGLDNQFDKKSFLREIGKNFISSFLVILFLIFIGFFVFVSLFENKKLNFGMLLSFYDLLTVKVQNLSEEEMKELNDNTEIIVNKLEPIIEKFDKWDSE